jgi:hypothetical protein
VQLVVWTRSRPNGVPREVGGSSTTSQSRAVSARPPPTWPVRGEKPPARAAPATADKSPDARHGPRRPREAKKGSIAVGVSAKGRNIRASARFGRRAPAGLSPRMGHGGGGERGNQADTNSVQTLVDAVAPRRNVPSVIAYTFVRTAGAPLCCIIASESRQDGQYRSASRGITSSRCPK